MIAFDHVAIGVADPEAVAERLRRQLGLGAIPGGVNDRMGVGSWIVPLRSMQYIELVYVVDPGAAARDPVHAQLVDLDMTSQPLLGWGVRTDDIAAEARRLGGAPVVEGEMQAADGQDITWRAIFPPEFKAGCALPWIAEYLEPEEARRQAWGQRFAAARHDIPAPGIASVAVAADPGQLRRWLGTAELPVEVREGNGTLEQVLVEVGEDRLVIDGGELLVEGGSPP